ncbi:MAG: hypothetical protein U5J99_14395 [Parvularculaceae bacterium]|nr:hypothetical protein [Parvularculaceae bacterium]
MAMLISAITVDALVLGIIDRIPRLISRLGICEAVAQTQAGHGQRKRRPAQ